MNQTKPPSSLTHAVVMGGSLGGLLTARVLSAHYQRVTILERDPIPDQPEARKGQPHTRHLHGLLATGLDVLTHYFPDLPQALADGGAIMPDFANGMNWYTGSGYRQRFQMGTKATLMSRPFLESLVRQRVTALPNVKLLDNCAVSQLMTTPDKQRVLGVEVEMRHEGNQLVTVLADLVVDCTGRGSRTTQWLMEMGYVAPPVSEVKVDVVYTTRLFKRDPADPRGQQWTLVTPEAPRETRFGAIFPIEGDRWIVSLGGWHGDHPPADEAGFMAFARSLPASDVFDVIKQAEPISDIIQHKFPFSLRRHYEKLHRFPQGYLVLGDAISSFNPTYGQGMTSAAIQVTELDKLLAKGTVAQDLAQRFFKRAAKVVDSPWQLAVGEDFRFPQTSGPKPAGTDFINYYVAKVHRATLSDPEVCLALLKVMNLMAPPPSLFHPRIVWRVLRARPSAQPTPVLTTQPAAGN
ncbi:MAG: FAD-binding monooxygenase [Anaerolineae bacterium]|nr:FAD-binding monooxygenase [Anaerolineae bacterium]